MRIRTVVLALTLAVPVAAQEFVYPKPDARRIAVHRDIAYRDALKFDVYRPATDDIVPLVIFANITGGPYATWPIYIGWANAAADAGIGAVLYQSAPNKGTENFDALVVALRERASELKIDPTRVVVWSGSANVRLGLPLAMDRSRDYVRGAAVFYGSATIAEIRTDLPLLYVRSGLDGTQLNREIDATISKALTANAPWTVENYAGGLHGFEVLNDNDVSREVISRTIAFIKSVTRPNVSRAYAALADDATVGAAFARDDWPAAIEGYRKRVAANPRDAESQRRLGLALLATKQYAEALPALETAHGLGRGGIRDTVYPAAQAAAGARNVTRTTYWLDMAFSSQFGPEVDDVRTSDVFAAVRDEPAFVDLLAGVEEQRSVLAMIDKGQSADALKVITTSKRERYQREAVLNTLGYRLLAKGKAAEAVVMFKLNADRHPQSANVWDSLAEAADAAGQVKDAVKYSRKALEVLANDKSLSDNGRQQIRNAAEARVVKLSRKS